MVRDLNKEELDRIGLYYYGDKVIQAKYTGCSTVFWHPDIDKDVTLKLFDRGTNDLVILMYDSQKDSWEEIGLEDIDNLYGLLWKIIIHLEDGEIKEV
jgi:hypothetical protein